MHLTPVTPFVTLSVFPAAILVPCFLVFIGLKTYSEKK